MKPRIVSYTLDTLPPMTKERMARLEALAARPDSEIDLSDAPEMTDEEWGQAYARCLGMFLSGEGLDERDERNRPIKDDTFLVLTNAHHEAIPFQLPATAEAMEWLSVLDTVQTDGGPGTARFRAGQSYPLEGRSLALLMQVPVVPAVVPG